VYYSSTVLVFRTGRTLSSFESQNPPSCRSRCVLKAGLEDKDKDACSGRRKNGPLETLGMTKAPLKMMSRVNFRMCMIQDCSSSHGERTCSQHYRSRITKSKLPSRGINKLSAFASTRLLGLNGKTAGSHPPGLQLSLNVCDLLEA